MAYGSPVGFPKSVADVTLTHPFAKAKWTGNTQHERSKAMISWDDPEWGHNPIHESESGSWLEAEGE